MASNTFDINLVVFKNYNTNNKNNKKYVLGVSFLEKRDPELMRLRHIPRVDELSVDRRQTVVNEDFRPTPKVPEFKPEYSCV